MKDERRRVRVLQKGEGPEQGNQRGPQGPDADHQNPGTKTARPDTPHPGQEDVR